MVCAISNVMGVNVQVYTTSNIQMNIHMSPHELMLLDLL